MGRGPGIALVLVGALAVAFPAAAGPWTRETVNGRDAYTTTPPAELLKDGGFTQLWVNGERRERPKLPKTGFWQVERGIDTKFADTWGHTHPSNALVYKEGQLSAGWHNLADVQLHLFGWWIDRHVKIRGIEEASRTAHFDRTARLRMEWEPGKSGPRRGQALLPAPARRGDRLGGSDRRAAGAALGYRWRWRAGGTHRQRG